MQMVHFIEKKCLTTIFYYSNFKMDAAVDPRTLQHLIWSSFRLYLTFGSRYLLSQSDRKA